MGVLEQYDLPNAQQYATVSNGVTSTIWAYTVPSGYVTFINKLGINWYPDCKWYFYIDGELVESSIERMIGSPKSPEEINPPYVARYSIKLDVYNGTSNSEVFEVVLKGVVVRQPNILDSGGNLL